MDAIDAVIEQWRTERPDLGNELDAMALVARMARVMARLAREVEVPFAPEQTTVADADVLFALRRSGEPFTRTPGELARELVLSPGGMTARLDRLEEQGLLTRAIDPGNRRSMLVTLTAKGRRLADRLVSAHVANEARILAGLTAADRATLDRLLRKLLASFDAN